VRRLLPWLCLGLLAAAALAAVAFRGPASTPTTADRVHQIAGGLRCPVCRDLSVADSPAPLAQQMRDTIAKGLEAGQTPDQIRDGFVAAYGESVLLSPPRRGIGLVAWLAPVLLAVAGAWIALAIVRRWRSGARNPSQPSGSGPPDRVRGADRRLLERALARLDEEERP
jgi:cytochrome c-type biogenesis protein CcmH